MVQTPSLGCEITKTVPNLFTSYGRKSRGAATTINRNITKREEGWDFKNGNESREANKTLMNRASNRADTPPAACPLSRLLSFYICHMPVSF